MISFNVNGIVSRADKQPYVQLSDEKRVFAQLSMTQARQVAADILNMCARTEADAMIIKFFDKSEFPEEAAGALLVAFRDFRAQLDDEKIEHTHREPPSGEARSCIHCGKTLSFHALNTWACPDKPGKTFDSGAGDAD
jgi:hypothetical protein